jgi:hypothetical protein
VMKYPRGIVFSLPHVVRRYLKRKGDALRDGKKGLRYCAR